MKILLDTHVAIWAVAYSKELTSDILNLLSDERNQVLVSVASVWEIAIKRAAGKRSAPKFSSVEGIRLFRSSGYTLLDVTADHAAAVEQLPRIHNDPFDRLLVAQAVSEPLRHVTRDRKVAAYSDTVIVF